MSTMTNGATITVIATGKSYHKHLGHQLYLGTGNDGKHITVKMDCTTLVFGVRKHFSHGFPGPGVKFCVSDIRQSQEWHWKAGRILA